MGDGFQAVLRRHRIYNHPTTVKNPQVNAICERLHQTVTNVLRPLLHIHPPQDTNEANLVMDTALQTASYSARAAIHHTLQTTPGELAFHSDMLLNIPFIVDMQLLRDKRQVLIDEKLMQVNRSRISYDYQNGDKFCFKPTSPTSSTLVQLVQFASNGYMSMGWS